MVHFLFYLQILIPQTLVNSKHGTTLNPHFQSQNIMKTLEISEVVVSQI